MQVILIAILSAVIPVIESKSQRKCSVVCVGDSQITSTPAVIKLKPIVLTKSKPTVKKTVVVKPQPVSVIEEKKTIVLDSTVKGKEQSKVPVEAGKQKSQQNMYLVEPVAKNNQKEPNFGLGLHGGLGVWPCNNLFFGQIGLRGRFFPARLGFDLSTKMDAHSATALFYLIDSSFKWSIGPGLSVTNQVGRRSFVETSTVFAQTGFEFELIRHLSIFSDARVPLLYSAGESFRQTQFIVGLMLQTW
jgi:hypothetical protein